jgi:hypothetical protein
LPIIIRLPGSTGMPKCSISPPTASSAAGMTSRRSAIADAPNTITSSAPALSSSSIARDSAACSCGTRFSAMIAAPAGARRVAVIFSVFSITFGERPGSRVDTTPTLRNLYGATRMTGFALFATTTASSRAFAATAKGMIFTVAIISPSTTGLNAGSVASVTASSMRLRPLIVSPSTTRTPAVSANKLHRPVKARSARTSGPAMAAAMSAAA